MAGERKHLEQACGHEGHGGVGGQLCQSLGENLSAIDRLNHHLPSA